MTLITGNKETKPPHMCKEYLKVTKKIYNLNRFISIQKPFQPQIQSYFSLLFSGSMFVIIFPVLIFKLLLSPSIFEFFSSWFAGTSCCWFTVLTPKFFGHGIHLKDKEAQEIANHKQPQTTDTPNPQSCNVS